MFRDTYEELYKAQPGTAAKSEKRARKLLEEILEAFVSGPTGARILGTTTYLLAMTELRAGKADDAAWHWQMAQGLVPELRQNYGDLPDLAPFLRDHLLRSERREDVERLSRGETAGDRVLPGDVGGLTVRAAKDVAPPVLVRKVNPAYPEGARMSRVSGLTVVDALIDTEGIPREPIVLHPCGVTVLVRSGRMGYRMF
jgi:hypothetical protein